jgi:UDP-N-acetyl-D-mannosaminuronate dehydrogenase
MTVSALGTALGGVKVVATVQSTPAFAASPITVAINGAVVFTTIESSATTLLKVTPIGAVIGGSCLPKDLPALAAESWRRSLVLPLIQSILPSNESHLEACIERVLATDVKQIGPFGLTFKEGTDDLRESPAVELAERLIGKAWRFPSTNRRSRAGRFTART